MGNSQLEVYLQEKRHKINQKLETILPILEEPQIIHQAMRHSVFAGGKRLRPILAITAYEISGGEGDCILMPACGLELIHTYSLIHDDLPCMDDDDYRRGRPTNHKIYGEAIAVLAGDALTALAFECLLDSNEESGFSEIAILAVVRKLARAIGTKGLVGGQVMDILQFSKDRQKESLEKTCEYKTGALIEASLECGALLAGADSQLLSTFKRYGRGVGLAFQITDDILNVTGDKSVMGKSPNTDREHEKVTFPELMGLENAKKEALRWIEDAKFALNDLGPNAWALRDIANYILERKS